LTPVLLDTGVLVALFDPDERRHSECLALVEELRRPLVTCEAVVAESCYLLRRLRGAAEAILDNVVRGAFYVSPVLGSSASSVQSIMRKYRDHSIDLADACLIHLAAELDTGEILTLDRDFLFYRWRKTRSFRLLISLE
jgi:predicted nucleic acid-binding protein